jgi:multidrug efflux pump subunit AcrB
MFREFTVTRSVAIVISLVISLTTTPMLCAHMLADDARCPLIVAVTGVHQQNRNVLSIAIEARFDAAK